MRSDVLNKNSGDYGKTVNLYPNGVSAQTADFTAADGYIYPCTLLSGCDITLPAPTTGAKIKVIFGGLTGGTHTITTDASTTLYEGYAYMRDSADQTAAAMEVFAADESDDRVLTLNATTTGISGIVEVTGLSTNRWLIEADLDSNGDAATPFS